MKDFLKRIKADLLVSSILCIILGVVFIVWSKQIISAIGTFLAVILIVIGIVYLCSYLMNSSSNGLSAGMGVIITIIGIWILIQPEIVISLIPIILGVVLLIHGIRDLKESFEAKRYGLSTWGISAFLSVISIGFGVLCIVDAFAVMQLPFIVMGIALIYNGISNIWIAIRTAKAAKEYNDKNLPLDVEFKD